MAESQAFPPRAEDFAERPMPGLSRRRRLGLVGLFAGWSGICVGAALRWESEWPYAGIAAAIVLAVIWNEHFRCCPQCHGRVRVRYVHADHQEYLSTRCYYCPACRIAWNTHETVHEAT